MSIWIHENVGIEFLNNMSRDTIAEAIGIEFTGIGTDYLVARMPVDRRTHQPYGLLHGGASAVLAETLGSVAAHLCIDTEKKMAVGLEINCNHIRGSRSGFVYGTARPLHIGGRTHVWEIKIENEINELVCVSRLTVAIISKQDPK